jgi:hypothetical protein
MTKKMVQSIVANYVLLNDMEVVEPWNDILVKLKIYCWLQP